MKKRNNYLADDEIDLSELIKKLWKEKILILSISIICGLLSYFYASLKPQEFKTEITVRNPPKEIFEPYTNYLTTVTTTTANEQFISEFKSNFLSIDNIQNFMEQSGEFVNFKRYLKSRNISVAQYFTGEVGEKLGEVKQANIIIPGRYFVKHSKELDGAIFLNNYAEFIKKKTFAEIKKNLKLKILNTLDYYNEAFIIATKIQLEDPLTKLKADYIIISELEPLFKGTKLLSQILKNLNNKATKLENDQFDYNIIIQKSITLPINPINSFLYFAFGLVLGLFLSFVIIFLKNYENKN
jgi:LPS O-antigen subunit length determinant protein (WzzB/FepE family)